MKKYLYNQSGFAFPLLLLLVVVVAAATGYLYLKKSEIARYPFVQQIAEKLNVEPLKPKATPSTTPVEITLTKDGFIPSSIEIVLGQQVTFVNGDDAAHRVIPYPLATRTTLPEFGGEDLGPTDSFTYPFEKIGTYTISENTSPGKYTVTIVVK